MRFAYNVSARPCVQISCVGCKLTSVFSKLSFFEIFGIIKSKNK